MAAAALGALVAAAYFPAFLAGFVWDDRIFTGAQAVREWSGLWRIWFAPAEITNEAHYWPLLYTTFWLEHKLWGYAPIGYHAVNVLLHAANTLLLWRLLARLAVPGAWVVAAVFAVHPLHVESVVWVMERKDVLSGLFYLAAFSAWVRFVEEPRPERRRRSYLLALALFVLGLLSKSIVVTLPAALAIWHWWRRGRVTGADLFRLAPLFAVALAGAVADVTFASFREPVSLGYSLVERVLIAARALWFYAGKLLWPADLAVIYPHWEVNAADPLAWVYVAAAVALAAATWLLRRRIGAGPLAGALFFAVTLAPVLGFVDYGYLQFSFVADRYQYLAGIGVIAVIAGAAAHGAGKLPGVAWRRSAAGVAALALLVLGTLTWRQAGIYRDGVTFFSHIVARNPTAREAHRNLGEALTREGRWEEALDAFRVAVEQAPDDAREHSNVGAALFKLGRVDEAEESLRHALALDPRSPYALQNLAALELDRQRYEEAVDLYRRLVEISPRNPSAHQDAGMALYHLGRFDEAIEALRRAVALRSDLPAAGALYVTMGKAARELGRNGAAAAWFERAAALEPTDPEPLFELAALRSSEQRTEEAAAYLRRARALRPDDAATLHRTGEVLRTQSRFAEAISAYRDALAADPDFAPAHAGLGIALYQSRRYEQALESMTTALALQPELPVAASLHLLMGHSRGALGEPAAAVDQYERALAIDPRNNEALDHLALSRFEEQRYHEALELYGRMAEIDPENARTHANRGAALFHLGRLEEALASFERAVALDPDSETAATAMREVRSALQQRGR